MTAAFDPFSVEDTARAVRRGRASAREVAEAAISRADRIDPQIRSLVWRDDPATLRAADALDARADRGEALPALAGVPVTVKDTFAIEGQPHARGSDAVGDEPATTTDLLPAAAFAAGCVQLGRSATPELAMTTSCESPRSGTTHNPWDLAHSPGGSSGGSAAAVSAGIVPASIASDGGGSLRVPAAFCGLVGLKPGRGVLPQRVQGWEGGATEGVITRTIRDTALMLRALSAPDRFGWAPPRTAPLDVVAELDAAPEPLRIGLLTEAFDPRIPVDAEAAAAAEDAAAALRAAGHEIVPVTAPEDAAELMDIYPRSIIPAWLQQTPLAHPERLQPYIRRVMAQADGLTAADYVREAILMRTLARRVGERLFVDVDIVLSPTSAARVPRIGVVLAELTANAPSRDSAVYEQTLAFTTIPSMLGLPALTVPTHLDAHGLPLGTQLIGPQHSDALLLRVGRVMENHHEWESRSPAVTCLP